MSVTVLAGAAVLLVGLFACGAEPETRHFDGVRAHSCTVDVCNEYFQAEEQALACCLERYGYPMDEDHAQCVAQAYGLPPGGIRCFSEWRPTPIYETDHWAVYSVTEDVCDYPNHTGGYVHLLDPVSRDLIVATTFTAYSLLECME